MIRLGWNTLAGVVLTGMLGFGVLALMNRPMSEEAVRKSIENRLEVLAAGNDLLSSALLTIDSSEPATRSCLQHAQGAILRKIRLERVSQYHSASNASEKP